MELKKVKDTIVVKSKKAWEATKRTAKSAVLSVECFAVNYPKTFGIACAAGVFVARQGVKSWRDAARDAEEKARQLRIWDPSLRIYLQLKKPIKTNEAVTIEERRRHGEKLIDILRDMNLLNM